ncbi:MAG: hypothetical protein IJF69_02605 [Clostridia bacterium]|nr:hypothetical protein [Clostridia bacterium]
MSFLLSGILLLCGCGGDDRALYDMAEHSDPVENCSTDVKVEYYSNGDYLVELICTAEKKGKSTYNLIIFSKESGEQKFFGTAEGDLSKGLSVCDVSEEKTVSLVADNTNNALDVEYKYKETVIDSFCGKYEYFDSNWTPAADEESIYIREGSYRRGEFKLSVFKGANTVRFVITDADGIVVCEGSQRVEGEASSVTVEYKNTKIEIAAGLEEGKLCIEVASYGADDECRYSGKYMAIE